MVNGRDAAFSHEIKARVLAKQAAKLAKEGRRAESEKAFRRAFDEVREVRGPLGSVKSDVTDRSRLATVLADEAFSAGMSATFVVEMWEVGCNSGCLSDDEKGSTQMFYPVQIMEMARREKGTVPEDAPPAVSCENEDEKRFGLLEFLWKITGLSLIFGEGETGKSERSGKNE